MARIIRKEVRRRGFFGWLFLIVFLAFNALMLAWLVAFWGQLGGDMASPDEARRAGTAIGAALGTGMIFFFWVAGAVITGLLALLTRGQRTYIEEVVD